MFFSGFTNILKPIQFLTDIFSKVVISNYNELTSVEVEFIKRRRKEK